MLDDICGYISYINNAHRNTPKTDTLAGIEEVLRTMPMMEESSLGNPLDRCLVHVATKETSWGVASYFQEIMCAIMIGKFFASQFMYVANNKDF